MKVSFKNFNKREKCIAVITFSIMGAALAYSFIIEPVTTQWDSLNNQIESKRNLLIKDKEILAKSKTIKAVYADLLKNVKPPKSGGHDMAEVMRYIETISRNDSCVIMNIKPISTQSFGSYKEVLIEISAEATMEQFSKFFYDLESHREMLLKLKRFSINFKSSQAGALKGTFLIRKILFN